MGGGSIIPYDMYASGMPTQHILSPSLYFHPTPLLLLIDINTAITSPHTAFFNIPLSSFITIELYLFFVKVLVYFMSQTGYIDNYD